MPYVANEVDLNMKCVVIMQGRSNQVRWGNLLGRRGLGKVRICEYITASASRYGLYIARTEIKVHVQHCIGMWGV